MTDDAVVLRAWDFSETSQTVSLFGRELGVVRGLAKGAKRERSSFAGGFEPLARGDITLVQRPTSELATLTEWQLRSLCHAARRRLRAHHIALYLVDLCDRSLSPADPHPMVFDALVVALDRLARQPEADGATTAGFQLTLLGECGYAPHLDPPPGPAPATLVFDAEAGTVRTAPAAPGVWGVRSETLSALRALEADEPSPEHDLWRGARLLHAYWTWQFRRELLSAALALGGVAGPPLPRSERSNPAPAVDSGVERSDDSPVAEPLPGVPFRSTGGTPCRSR
ncbi:MAG: DNA repair protein RecO [Planctomycetota bacterium]